MQNASAVGGSSRLKVREPHNPGRHNKQASAIGTTSESFFGGMMAGKGLMMRAIVMGGLVLVMGTIAVWSRVLNGFMVVSRDNGSNWMPPTENASTAMTRGGGMTNGGSSRRTAEDAAGKVDCPEIPLHDQRSSLQTMTTVKTKKTLHMMHCLFGDNEEFHRNWELALKSVLANAPLDSDLHLHIIANKQAADIVKPKLEPLQNTKWRNQIQISLYNVDDYADEWLEFVMKNLDGVAEFDTRVTIGAYYRLLAPQRIIVKHHPEVTSLMYMDSDVVVMSNLNDIMKHAVAFPDTTMADHRQLYQWTEKNQCSGFMMLNAPHMEEFWGYIQRLNQTVTKGDQALLVAVGKKFPHTSNVNNQRHFVSSDKYGNTTYLPIHWDVHLAHGWKARPHDLFDHPSGMVHFNGLAPKVMTRGDEALMSFCKRSKECIDDEDNQMKYRRSWGLVDYYVRLDWKWLIYMFGESLIALDDDGKELQFRVIDHS